MKTCEKKLNYEILRICCILLVLFNHTNTKGFFLFPLTDNPFSYLFSLVLSILCKIAVPLFFMVSGSLLMNKTESLETVLKKRVLRMGAAIVLASAFTYVLSQIHQGIYHLSPRELLKIIYRGSDIDTYWFLYAYISLLLILPFLRGISTALTKHNIHYLTILYLIFTGILPMLIFISLGHSMPTILDIVLLSSSVYYFLAGAYYGHAESCFENLKIRILSYTASILVLFCSCFMTYYEYRISGVYTENFFNGLLPVICITVFLSVRRFCEKREFSSSVKKMLLFLGDKTFGIYLLEPVLKLYFMPVYTSLTEKFFSPLTGSILWVLFAGGMGVLIVTALKQFRFFKWLL